MISKVFAIWIKKIEALSFESRRSKLKEFAARGIKDSDTLEMIKMLLDQDYLKYAGELYYYSYLQVLENTEVLEDSYELISNYIENTGYSKSKLIAGFLICQKMKDLKPVLKTYLEKITAYSKLSADKKREIEIRQFCKQILPYLCFSEASDMLFIVFSDLHRVSHAYSSLFGQVIDSWIKNNGNTDRPVTEIGKKVLITDIRHLTLECEFVVLNRIHYRFPTLTDEDFYGKTFPEMAVATPWTVLNDPNSAIYYLNSYKRFYANGEEAYSNWLELYKKASYSSHDWFKVLAYMEHVNINLRILDSKCDLPRRGKVEVPIYKTEYEIIDIFAKVLTEKPQSTLTFLRNITIINTFGYDNKPQLYNDKVISTVVNSYLSKAFIKNYEEILLTFFSLKDFLRIYINSPLHQIGRIHNLCKRLDKMGIELDISKTPLSQVLFKGYLYFEDEDFFFYCPKISSVGLKVSHFTLISEDEFETIKQSRCLVATYLDGYVYRESVSLDGVSILSIDEGIHDYKQNNEYLKRKIWAAKDGITEIYLECAKTRSFDKERLLDYITVIENSPKLFEHQNINWGTALCIAQTKAYLAMASDDNKLSEIIDCTNGVWDGRLNYFINDPFGQNTTRVLGDEYQSILQALLEGNPAKIYNQLSDEHISGKAVRLIYLNSIVKRVMSFDWFYRLLLMKTDCNNDKSENVLGSLRSFIFYGEIVFYDTEKKIVYVKPVSFNPGKVKFIAPYTKRVVAKQKYYFSIDSYDYESDICYIRELSTKADLAKCLPKESFKSALLASYRGSMYFVEDELSKFLNQRIIPGLFDEDWYDSSIHSYLCAMISQGNNVVKAIERLGGNNAFSFKKELMDRASSLTEADADVYKMFITKTLSKKKMALYDLVQIFMNSPMRLIIPVDYLIGEYIKVNGSVTSIISELMQYTIKVEKNANLVRFVNVLCSNYEYDGELATGEYYIAAYDMDGMRSVLKKICID